MPVKLEITDGGVRVLGTSEPFVLYSPGVEWSITSDGLHDTATALVQPTTAQPVVLELRCGTTDLGAHELSEVERRDRAGRYWSDWTSKLQLPAVQTDLVRRSALTLRGLVNTDTGGVLAAATSSLPEEIGGVRNWDYRYCWIRDAAMTVRELVHLGSIEEAEGYLRWLHGVLATLAGPGAAAPAVHPRRQRHRRRSGRSSRCPVMPVLARSGSATWRTTRSSWTSSARSSSSCRRWPRRAASCATRTGRWCARWRKP